MIVNNFNSITGWNKSEVTTDSTFSVSSNQGSLTPNTTHYETSAWALDNTDGRNVIMEITCVNASNNPQIHLRESNKDNFIVGFINTATGTLYIGKRVGGALTLVTNTVIPNFSSSNSYKLVMKVFGNHTLLIISDSTNKILKVLDYTNSAISALTGTRNGLGANGGVTLYEGLELSKINEYTNIVFLGDSNTAGYPSGSGLGYNTDFDKTFPELLQQEWKDEPVSIISSGIDGNTITALNARLGTDLYPRLVSGATNIAVVLIGTNDMNTDSAATAWGHLQTLINNIQSNGWLPVVMTYPPKDGDVTRNDKLREFNDDIRNNADKLNYVVIDLWNAMVDPNDDNANEFVHPDGLHFTEMGHLLTFGKVISQISCRLVFP